MQYSYILSDTLFSDLGCSHKFKMRQTNSFLVLVLHRLDFPDRRRAFETVYHLWFFSNTNALSSFASSLYCDDTSWAFTLADSLACSQYFCCTIGIRKGGKSMQTNPSKLMPWILLHSKDCAVQPFPSNILHAKY